MAEFTAERSISFSPPDFTEAEIASVAEAMRSGWITTGPKTKELEQRLHDYTHAGGLACLASATAALESALRALSIGPGDEVITTAYTYTASCSAICHVGATPVMVDVIPGTYEIDCSAVADAVTPRTKAVIPVDVAGRMIDYSALFDALDGVRENYRPANDIQRRFDRPVVIADAAHSLGANYHGRPSGSVADFTAFSFHAVKNFTTAEGGAIAWREGVFDDDALYHQMMLLSLHGQSKDALAKNQLGAWEYDIVFPGWKCNMTDIQAAIGLVQLDRYPGLLARRRDMVGRYEALLADVPVELFRHFDDDSESSGHLMLTRVLGASPAQRNEIITLMAQAGIATNVHYKPLPLLSAYADLGFDISDYPHAYAQFANEITLPLHTLLSDEDIDYICDTYRRAIMAVMG